MQTHLFVSGEIKIHEVARHAVSDSGVFRG